METKESLDDDKQWLTYWMVYAIFTYMDQALSWVLNMIPFYYLIKLLILIWMMSPLTNGATTVYQMYLKPLGRKYETELNEAADLINDFLKTKTGWIFGQIDK